MMAALCHDPPVTSVHQVDRAMFAHALARVAAQRRQDQLDAALREIRRQYGPTLFIEKILWAVRRQERNLSPERILPAATLRDIRRAFAKLDNDPTLSRR